MDTEQIEALLVYVTITLLPSLLLTIGIHLLLGLLATGENHEERRVFLTIGMGIGITAVFMVATMPFALPIVRACHRFSENFHPGDLLGRRKRKPKP